MNDLDSLIVEREDAGVRLDKFLAKVYASYSRQYFQYLIEEKLVLVNGELSKKSIRLEEGDEIEIEFALTPEISLDPENIPLDILYEDADLLAINKPAGMVVHPAVGNWSGTFVNALLYHCKHLPTGDSLRPGIVHRLDKDTTGVLIAAKNERTQQKLVEAFASRSVKKVYFAICVGNPTNRIIEKNIGRHPVRRKEMTVLEEGGRAAKTRCETLAFQQQLSFVRLFPETGRTHQLRVHLKHVGTPILGDMTYGNISLNKKYNTTRQLLHAHTLEFTHPTKGTSIEIKAPVPHDMLTYIRKIGGDAFIGSASDGS